MVSTVKRYEIRLEGHEASDGGISVMMRNCVLFGMGSNNSFYTGRDQEITGNVYSKNINTTNIITLLMSYINVGKLYFCHSIWIVTKISVTPLETV